MAILSTAEQADMLKRMANRVIDDNRSQPLYPSYARAILNVLAAFESAQTQLAAVPVEAIIAYRANSDESEGLIRNGDHEAFADFAETMRVLDEWLETQVTP